MKAGKKEEGRRDLVEAGKKRLSTLQERSRKSIYASPLPYWADQVLLQIALAATLSGATPDYEFVVQAQAVLGRSVETGPDVALATQAIQRSDERKRIAQSLRTIEYQQMDWERSRMADLVKRLASPERRDSDVVSKSRLQILDNGNEFIRHRQRLRAALLGDGNEGVDSVAHLATLKGLLLPDEALVFHAPILGAVGKVCIRADRTLSTLQAVDWPAVARDARLLRAALTATHPASIEADSQFPAVEAVRLGKLLFGGLEKCLRSSRRVYVVATAGDLGLVPPAVLLTEMPPVMGSGFDLRAAHWMIRDHSFVRTTSLDAFVATKRLSKRKRATLDYLGVGDPALATRRAAGSSGGQSALAELPETSEELKRVAGLFKASKTRILRRQRASEEAFRLQPLSEFDVIHFATHGLVREEEPGLREPSLVLTPNPAGDPFDDGLLTSSQIAALPLRARLVVLSACNSARYDASIIDSGIQGLSTSFAVAGVPSMIASLWPIESALTRDLIVATFRAARSGNVAIADALAIAVRKHLERPGPRPLLHPRFWAALVVLGDGSMTLNSPAEAPRRDLGAFVPVNSSNGDDILSAAALDGDFITSTIGAWNGKRSPSLVRRQTAGGIVKWEVEDGEIGAGPVAAAQQTVYAGGYLSFPDGAFVKSVPVLRGLNADGKVLWSHEIPSGPKSALLWGLAVDATQSALALVGPPLGDKTGAAFSLSRIDRSGTEVAHMAIAVQGEARFGQSGSFAVNKDTGLAAISRNARPKEGAWGVNWLGMSRICWQSEAEIILVDLSRFKEERRSRIDEVRVESALAVNDGWILVGDVRDECGLAAHAAAYKVNSDGTVVQLWRDASPFDTFASGVREVDGGIQIVGYAKRSVAIREETPSLAVPDFGSKRSGDEAYISGELFSVHLSERGVEQRRDFAGAGFPIIPRGMASAKDRSAIFGSIGSRALWMAF